MARPCKICTHPKRAEIEEAITTHNAANRDIARRYRLIESNIRRHKPHIELTDTAREIVQARNARLDQVSLAESLFHSIAKVEQWIDSDDKGFALAASREHREKLKALFVMLGDTQKTGEQLPILKHHEWPSLAAQLKGALVDVPGAFEKFMQRLKN